MATLTKKAPSKTVFLTFNPRDKRAVQFLTTIQMLDFFKVEESPYDPTFVAKIKRAEKSKTHIVDVNKLWD